MLLNHATCTTSEVEEDKIQVHNKLIASNWYKDIVYFLQNLQYPPDFDKAKESSLKLKVVKYCIINVHLFWKDPMGVLLNCIDEDEVGMIMEDFHNGVCRGHITRWILHIKS